MNFTTINPDKPSESLIATSLAFYWISVVFCFFMGLISSFGNGLVLYISNKKDDFGGYCQVNWVVKNLAFSDMLFGLVGCPLTILFWTWGKKQK